VGTPTGYVELKRCDLSKGGCGTLAIGQCMSNETLTSEVVRYLTKHFVTLSQLSEASGIGSSTIMELVRYRCIPSCSYRLSTSTVINSQVFGDTTIEEASVELYFSPSVTVWIRRAMKLLEHLSLELASLHIKNDFKDAYLKALLESRARELPTYGFLRLEQDDSRICEQELEEVWDAWAKGTYGVCTQNPETAERIARKNVVVALLEQLTNNGEKKVYSHIEAKAVAAAIREYDSIAMPFSPHDRALSSRQRLVDNVLPYIEATERAHSLNQELTLDLTSGCTF